MQLGGVGKFLKCENDRAVVDLISRPSLSAFSHTDRHVYMAK